jgi:hypothetical protein
MEQEEQSFFDESRQQIEGYIKDRILLLKLETAHKTAHLSALLFTGLILSLLSFFVLLFLSMMGGYFFSSLTGSQYVGFGIVAAFYLLLLILVILFRKPLIEKRIGSLIVNIFFRGQDLED